MATISEALTVALQHHRAGELRQAEAIYRQILQVAPHCADAWYLLGALAHSQGQAADAVAHLRRALELNGTHPYAHNSLGEVYRVQEKWAEAAACYRQALHYMPDLPDAHNNLGIVFQAEGQLDEAVVCYRRALELRPEFTAAQLNLGTVLHDQGKVVDAIRWYDRVLQSEPELAHAHWNRASARLLLGDYAHGWPEYEWRWKIPEHRPRSFASPQWDGRALDGRTILVHAEQGLGDALQFIRYLPLVKRSGGTVIYECHRPLQALFSRTAGIDRLIVQGDSLPPCDFHCPLLSLPGVFGTTLETVPQKVPYLAADPALVKQWGEVLRKHQGFKIGIAWQGGSDHTDRCRSIRPIPLVEFAPLAAVPGVRLISVQKGPGVEQIQQVRGRFAVVELGGLDEQAGAFMDTAAVMQHLDLVVTSDMAIGHLAGALGVPVWVGLPPVPDWRWLLDRGDSPWYPTMRLFRQAEPGTWNEVFSRMAHVVASRIV